MEVSGELHAPATLVLREGTPVFSEYEAGWAPEAVCMLRGREKSGWSSTLCSADGWLLFAVVSVRPVGPTLNFPVRDFRLPPRFNGDIRSSGMLCMLGW